MPNAIARSSWQTSTQPVTGPARKTRFQRGVIHYEGVNRDRTPTDIAQHLRNMQASYLSGRGYSLGYGYAVVSDSRHPDDGTRWEIRGADLNMASNPGRRWNDTGNKPSGNANDWTGSVLLIGPTGVQASSKAVASVRTILSEWHTEAGTEPIRPFPHSTLDYTTCCGAAYLTDLNNGRFDPTPTPPPIDGDDDVAAYLVVPPPERHGKPWLFVSSSVRPATSFDIADGVPRRKMVDQYRVEQYDALAKSAGL